MHRARFILIFSLLTGYSSGRTTENDAIANYLRPKVAELIGNESDWKNSSNGGYLVRQHVDLNGDGKPELILTSSFSTSKFVSEWAIFDVASDGSVSPYAESIDVYVDSIRLFPFEGDTGILFQGPVPRQSRLNVPEEDWVMPYTHYRFHFPHVEKEEIKLPYAEALKLNADISNKRIRTEGILLADFVRGKNNWTPVEEWEIDSIEKLQRDEDWAQAVANTDFTAEVALKELEKLGSSADRRPQGEKSDAKAAAPASTQGGGEIGSASSGRGWAIPVSVIAAAISGLAAFLLKKRKAA